jgi:hypothetical protein
MITKELKKLPLDKLEIPDGEKGYQRTAAERTVRQKAQNWRDYSSRELLVAPVDKKESKYRVIDGGTRLRAALKLGIKEFDCIIYRGITYEEEAGIFADQIGKSIRPVDLFKAKIVEGDLRAITLDEIIRSYDLRLTQHLDSERSFAAVGTLWQLISLKHFSINAIRDIMEFINNTWQFDGASKQGKFIYAIAILYAHQKGDKIKMQAYHNRLKKYSALRIVRRAEELKLKGVTSSLSIITAIYKMSRTKPDREVE